MLSEALPYMQRYDRQDGGGEIWRPCHGRPCARRRFRPRHRADQAGRREPDRGAWRRPADRLAARAAQYQERVQGRLARHRPRDGRGGRDGAGRLGQQGDRHRHQQPRRQGGRHLRQGRQSDAGQAARAALARSRLQYRADRRSRLRRRSRRSRSAYHRRDHQFRPDPGGGADRRRAGRRDAQHQRRHLRGGARLGLEGEAAVCC